MQPPSLRDRILEVLKEHAAGEDFKTILGLLGLPSDKKTMPEVTEALEGMKEEALILQYKDRTRKNRIIYRVLSDAEKLALREKLTSLSQLN